MSQQQSDSPTPRRRQLAREEGVVARSHELASAIAFLGAIGAIILCGPSLLQALLELLRVQFADPSIQHVDVAVHAQRMQEIGTRMLWQIAQPLVIIFAAVGVAHLAQTGFLWLPDRWVPDFRRIDPVNGLTRIASSGQIVRLLFQLAKLMVLVAVAAALLWDRLPELLGLAAKPMPDLLRDGTRLLTRFAITLGMVLLALGVVDYAIQRWKHERQLQLSPEDKRDDVRAVHNDVTFARRAANSRGPYRS